MQMNKLRAVVSYLFPLGAQTLSNMRGGSFRPLKTSMPCNEAHLLPAKLIKNPIQLAADCSGSLLSAARAQ